MNLIRNEKITFKVLNKEKKVIKEKIIKNRVLDNFLDWGIYKVLPKSIGDSLFSKFTNSTAGPNTAYLTFDTTPVVDDTTTNITFDLKSIRTNANLEISDRRIDFTSFFEITIPASQNNKKLTSFGFGILDTVISDYLFSWVDLNILDIIVLEGFVLQIIREDIYETLANTSGGIQRLNDVLWQIDKIEFYFDTASTDLGESKPIGDLTIVTDGIGAIKITGFSPFVSLIELGRAIYPSIHLFPSVNLYPYNVERQYVRCKFRLKGKIGTSFEGFLSDFDVNIKDLDTTFNNGTIEIKYNYSRG